MCYSFRNLPWLAEKENESGQAVDVHSQHSNNLLNVPQQQHMQELDSPVLAEVLAEVKALRSQVANQVVTKGDLAIVQQNLLNAAGKVVDTKLGPLRGELEALQTEAKTTAQTKAINDADEVNGADEANDNDKDSNTPEAQQGALTSNSQSETQIMPVMPVMPTQDMTCDDIKYDDGSLHFQMLCEKSANKTQYHLYRKILKLGVAGVPKLPRERCVHQRETRGHKCPDWRYFRFYNKPQIERRRPVMLDIGCNKGYESAMFLDKYWHQGGVNWKALAEAHKKQGTPKYWGTCNEGNLAEHQYVYRHVTRNHSERTYQIKPRIHCVEGSPTTTRKTKNAFEMAATDKSALEHVFFHNYVMTNYNGTFMFSDCDTSETCRIGDGHTHIHGKPVLVPTTTVDARFGPLYDTIDFFKIDAEGAEPMILQGALETLRSGKIKLISMELNGLREESVGLFDYFGYTCYADGQSPFMLLTGCMHLKGFQKKVMRNMVCASRRDPQTLQILQKSAQM
eukprot:gnl/MRDRNA2_/MRDRNA2_14858_c0_seq1.p1 gnl/MRDRNA2_/MRDRNA2_14858_c0~~gnl/MRDRNA2_/MRDRNA2_14858_c0_seq1.p1  ORF type:complete len:510 (+),score=77.83 gnl/MRDRNA2_/MRDRNA2_14858_c0_seq1:1-1530(+)